MQQSQLSVLTDAKRYFVWYFLEGQNLISELAILHDLNQEGFRFFRDVTLSAQLLISTLKQQEGLGFYLDFKKPEFLLKLETNFEGSTRSLLLPEKPEQFPATMTGTIRVVKTQPGKSPYTSHIKAENLPREELMNQVLDVVYQTPARIVISEYSDQSLMIQRLPLIGMSQEEQEEIPELHDYLDEHKNFYEQLFQSNLTDSSEIQSILEQKGLKLLGSKEIRLNCQCSEKKMQYNLRLCYQNQSNLFLENESEIKVRCDYCKTDYYFTREDLVQIH